MGDRERQAKLLDEMATVFALWRHHQVVSILTTPGHATALAAGAAALRELAAFHEAAQRDYTEHEAEVARLESALLQRLEARIATKFTPALNTGTAFDALLLVGAAIRELTAEESLNHD